MSIINNPEVININPGLNKLNVWLNPTEKCKPILPIKNLPEIKSTTNMIYGRKDRNGVSVGFSLLSSTKDIDSFGIRKPVLIVITIIIIQGELHIQQEVLADQLVW